MQVGTSLAVGATIAVGDMLLRPQFGTGISQMFRFLAEGVVCVYVFDMVNASGSGSGESDASSLLKDTGSSCATGSLNLMSGAIIGVLIAVTDQWIRPEYYRSLGGEFVKFLIQGIIVSFVLGNVEARQMLRAANK